MKYHATFDEENGSRIRAAASAANISMEEFIRRAVQFAMIATQPNVEVFVRTPEHGLERVSFLPMGDS